MLVSQLTVFLQRTINDVFELRRQRRVQTDGRNRGAVEDGIEDDAGSLAPEWNGAGRHLVHYNSKGKQVGAGIQFLAPHLLGRHVGDRA